MLFLLLLLPTKLPVKLHNLFCGWTHLKTHQNIQNRKKKVDIKAETKTKYKFVCPFNCQNISFHFISHICTFLHPIPDPQFFSQLVFVFFFFGLCFSFIGRTVRPNCWIIVIKIGQICPQFNTHKTVGNLQLNLWNWNIWICLFSSLFQTVKLNKPNLIEFVYGSKFLFKFLFDYAYDWVCLWFHISSLSLKNIL